MNNQISKIIDIPSGLTSNSIVPVIEQLNNFVNQSETNLLVINFSDTIFATPGGLTPLLCYLRDIPRIRSEFKGLIVPSKNNNIDSYISRMGFYTMLGMEDDYELQKNSGEGRFQELYCFDKNTDERELLKINEQVVKTFTMQSINENYINAVNWCLWEIVDNARNHANSEECVLFAQKYGYSNMTEFCVADRGVGIRETMGDLDIITALSRCIKQERGLYSTGMGNGLHFTSELIKKDKSKKRSLLTIWSEDAMVKIASGFEPKIEKTNTFWGGTIVTLSLSTEIETNLVDIKGSPVYGCEDLPDFYS